jgi:ABC-type glycerol-3-phosphate transport system permease component
MAPLFSAADGAATLTIIFPSMAPISAPALIAFPLFSAVYQWSHFLLASG